MYICTLGTQHNKNNSTDQAAHQTQLSGTRKHTERTHAQPSPTEHKAETPTTRRTAYENSGGSTSLRIAPELLFPTLFTLGALVEAGHGLVRGAKLHHQEERLLVVAERARRLRSRRHPTVGQSVAKAKSRRGGRERNHKKAHGYGGEGRAEGERGCAEAKQIVPTTKLLCIAAVVILSCVRTVVDVDAHQQTTAAYGCR